MSLSSSSTLVDSTQAVSPISGGLNSFLMFKYGTTIVADDRMLREFDGFMRWITDQETDRIFPRYHSTIYIQPSQIFEMYITCPSETDYPDGVAAVFADLYCLLADPTTAIHHRFQLPATGVVRVPTTHTARTIDLVEFPFFFPGSHESMWFEGNGTINLRLELSTVNADGRVVPLSDFDWRCMVADWVSPFPIRPFPRPEPSGVRESDRRASSQPSSNGSSNDQESIDSYVAERLLSADLISHLDCE